MKSIKMLLICAAMSVASLSSTLMAGEKEYTIGYSHYTGWEPWAYIHEFGLMDKWNAKMGSNVTIEFYNDYGASLDMMTSGAIHGVTATNMDALLAPAAGGIEITALINGDFSNGNDALVIRGDTSCASMKNREVLLFEGTVSHYALNRYLVDTCNMSLDDVNLMNTSDADIATTYLSSKNSAAVAWNPPLQVIMGDPNTNIVFDSSKIPGEILDSLYVRTDMSDNAKKAITGAWYEAMQIMSTKGKKGREMIQYMAEYSGATPNEFKAQMRTTAFFVKPTQAVAFTKDSKLKETMALVRSFIWDTKLISSDIKSANQIGISFPDGTVQGNESNVLIHFDTTYMQLAVDNKL